MPAHFMKLQVFKNGDKNYDDNDNGNVDMIKRDRCTTSECIRLHNLAFLHRSLILRLTKEWHTMSN